jgi:hypothetical protein
MRKSAVFKVHTAKVHSAFSLKKQRIYRRMVMRQFRKRLLITAAAGILGISALTGCSRSMNNDAVVAEVDKDEIVLGVANFYARMQQAQYESYYASILQTTGDEMWTQKGDGGDSYEETTKQSILESLENLYLLKQHASEYDIEVTDDEDKAIDKVVATFMEDNTLEAKEAVSGSEAYIKEFLELATIQNKMSVPMKAGVNEEVSDDDAAQKSMQYVFFTYSKTDDDGNTETMSDEEKTALKKTAQEFADKLKSSETKDIAAAAAEAGLEIQTTTFDAEAVSPTEDLIKAADALKDEGETTDIVESDSGIYVAKLISMLDREATDAKKASIVEERKQEQYDALLKQWRDDADIKEHKSVWKKVSFADQGVNVKTSTGDTTD